MLITTFENTFGALLISTIFASYLVGVVTVQVHYYFTHYPDDRTLWKITVFLLFCFELAHTAGTAHSVYTHTIASPATIQARTTLPGIYIASLMGGFITFIVQTYLSVRVYRTLHPPWKLVGIVTGVLATLRAVAVVVLVSQLFGASDYRKSIADWGDLITGLLSASAATDVIIAVAMLYYLFTQRERSFRKVQQLIDKLMLITVRSGLLTSITAVTVLVIFQIIPYTFAWLAIYTCLAKLYTITFLSALNGRGELRQAMSAPHISDLRPAPSQADVSGGHTFHPKRSRSKRNRVGYSDDSPISIEMMTTTNVNIDGVHYEPRRSDVSSTKEDREKYAY
ncbi:hypothetical protein P691DRAFT_776664 [Macrolepiota fuliginosa MF-IS2]|uniref:DUF6534 domain-containing protein n=1 Tax=Macrolepiota fuliginosa MF-IS2 TaxID=1400762 RepID=A0A9P5XB10_9AGAR|nr:hypothetical protein P691DRAFT_776664 [Macrolepiota fuliginosa MF-IS2]